MDRLGILIIVYLVLLIFVLFENFSLIWRRHHFPMKGCNFLPVFCTYGQSKFFRISTQYDKERPFLISSFEDPRYSHAEHLAVIVY